jgi:PAS domain-containing protein
MPKKQSLNSSDELLLEIEELRSRLMESEEALNAIRSGDVDSIIVSGEAGEKVFSLTSSETPYRIILEEMDEGAVITDASGTILYFNKRFEAIFSVSHELVNVANITEFISGNQKYKLKNLLKKGIKEELQE